MLIINQCQLSAKIVSGLFALLSLPSAAEADLETATAPHLPLSDSADEVDCIQCAAAAQLQTDASEK